MMWIIHYNPHHRFEHAIIRSSNSWKYSYMAFLGILISTKKQVLFSYFTQSQADFLKSRLLKFSYQAGAKICYHLTPCNHISSDWLKNLLYEFLSANLYTQGYAEVSFFDFPFRQFTFFQRVSNQRSFSFPLRGWSLLNVVLLVFL